MYRLLRAASSGAIALLCAGGCSSAAGPVNLANGDLSLIVLSGGAQTALEYTQLPQPIVVQVLNQKGKPVADQIVNFKVVQGGGSVWAGSALTNGKGKAQEWWTLGDAASRQLLEARAVDQGTGEQLVLGSILATATPLGATSFQWRCGNQTTWLPDPAVQLPGPQDCGVPTGISPGPSFPNGSVVTVHARLRLSDGTPVPGMTLDLFALGGGAPAVDPPYAQTDANGEVSMNFTIGSLKVLNTVELNGPAGSGVQGHQDFRAGY
jgi:hypothetical protein